MLRLALAVALVLLAACAPDPAPAPSVVAKPTAAATAAAASAAVLNPKFPYASVKDARLALDKMHKESAGAISKEDVTTNTGNRVTVFDRPGTEEAWSFGAGPDDAAPYVVWAPPQVNQFIDFQVICEGKPDACARLRQKYADFNKRVRQNAPTPASKPVQGAPAR